MPSQEARFACALRPGLIRDNIDRIHDRHGKHTAVEPVKHAAVDRFVSPDEFADYAATARGKGFLMVSATPLTRSSYHADADFAQLKAARDERLALSAPVAV